MTSQQVARLPSITPHGMYETMLQHNPENRVILFNGAPGIGKTAIPQQAAKANGVKCHVILGSQMEPTDVHGIPFPNYDDENAIFLAHKIFTDIEDGEWVLVDEINRARIEMQNALMQFVLERLAGVKRLGKNVKMFGTANPPNAQNMVFPISAPLINRMIVMNVVADSEDWITWATVAGIDPIVIGFIQKNPGALCPEYDASKHIPTEFNPWPSPRAYVSVSMTLAENNKKHIERAKILGSIGTTHGQDFITYQAVGHRLPDPDRLIDGLEPFPREADIVYVATYSAISRVMERVKKGGIRDTSALCKFFKTVLDKSNAWPAECVATIANIISKSPIAKRVLLTAVTQEKDKYAIEFTLSDAMRALTEESQGLDDGNQTTF